MLSLTEGTTTRSKKTISFTLDFYRLQSVVVYFALVFQHRYGVDKKLIIAIISYVVFGHWQPTIQQQQPDPSLARVRHSIIFHMQQFYFPPIVLCKNSYVKLRP